MAQAVDYSTARPNPADLAAAGYVGALRYLAPLPNKKVVDRPEIDALHAAGLSVGFVWETAEQRAAKSGYDGGKQDAQTAIAMLEALGAPPETAIYFVLEDPQRIPASQWSAALAYAQGVLDVGGPYRHGGYGGQALLEEARARGLIQLLWQVGGWSTDRVGHLWQRSDAAANPPAGTDVNDVLQDDWGGWLPGQSEENELTKDENKTLFDIYAFCEENARRGEEIKARLDALEAKVGSGGVPSGDVPLSGTVHFG